MLLVADLIYACFCTELSVTSSYETILELKVQVRTIWEPTK